MPLATCPSCQYEQIVPRELDGLIVACAKCRAEYRVGDKPERTSRRSADAADVGEAVRTLGKTFGLIAGLVAVVLVAIGGFAYVARSNRNAEKELADLRDPDPAIRQAAEDRRRQDQAAKAKMVEETADQAKSAVGLGLGLGLGLLVLVMFVLYLACILLAGGWVAKDAYARGMSGLGWASFYYLFQIISRCVVVVLVVIPAALAFRVSTLGILLGEPAYWVGMFVYLYARRPGEPTRCAICGNRRLGYLSTCPHCGRPQ